MFCFVYRSCFLLLSEIVKMVLYITTFLFVVGECVEIVIGKGLFVSFVNCFVGELAC